MKSVACICFFLIFVLKRTTSTPITRTCHLPLQNETYLTFQLLYDLNWYNPDYYASENLPNEFPSTQSTTEDSASKSVDDVIAEYESKLTEAREKIKEKYLDPQIKILESEIDATHLELVNKYKEDLNNNANGNEVTFDASFSVDVQPEEPSYLENCQSEYVAQLEKNKIKAIEDFKLEVEKAIGNIKKVHERLIARFYNCLINRQNLLAKYNEEVDKKAFEILSSYKNKVENMQTRRLEYIKSTLQRLYNTGSNDQSYEGPIELYNKSLENEVLNAIKVFYDQLKEKTENLKHQYKFNLKCTFNSGITLDYDPTIEFSSVMEPYIGELYRKINFVKNFDYEWIGAEISNLQNFDSDKDKLDCLNSNDSVLNIKEKSTTFLKQLKEKVAGWKETVVEWKKNTLLVSEGKNKANFKLPKKTTKKSDISPRTADYKQYLNKRSSLWIAEQEKNYYAEIATVEKEVCEKIEAWKTKAITHVENVLTELSENENYLERVEMYKNRLEKQREEQKLFHETQLLMLSNEHKQNFNEFYSSAFGAMQFDEPIQNLRTSYFCLVDAKVEQAMSQFAEYWERVQPTLVEDYKCNLHGKVKVTVPDLELNYEWELKEPSVNVFMWR